MEVTTLTQAVEGILTALEGVDAPGHRVHPPPVPTRPVAGPCVLVGTPQLGNPTRSGCGVLYEATVEVLITAADTEGRGLVDLADTVIAAINSSADLTVSTTAPELYAPPNQAPLPALLITVE